MVQRRKDSKNRVLKEGEYQRKDLTYEYKWRDSSGKRHSIYAATLEELRIKEDSVKLDILEGVKPKLVDKTTIDDVYARWKQIKAGTIKDNTFQNYVYIYTQYVAGGFGQRRINEVKKSDICAFYNYLHNQRGLSPNTIDNCHTVLIQLFTMSYDDGTIRRNPAQNAFKVFKKALGTETPKKKGLTVEQQDLLERYLTTVPKAIQWYPIIIVLLYTGLRIGECTGLRWCDIDLESGIVDINHTLVYYCKDRGTGKNADKSISSGRCGYAINPPKTEAGNRTIPMCDKVKAAFIMEKERQSELGIKCDVEIDGYTDFIFLNRFGNPYYYMTLNKAFDRIIRDCNIWALERNKGEELPVLLPHFSCHILRHTFVNRSIEAGCSLKALTSILGHTSADITLDVYADCSEAFKKNEMQKVEALGASFGLGEEPDDDEEEESEYDQLYDQITTTSCQDMRTYATVSAGVKEEALAAASLC